MTVKHIFVVVLIFPAILMVFSYPHENAIKWIPGNNALVERVVPAGFENGQDVFLCRVTFPGNFIPGKLVFSEGTVHCSVAYQGSEQKFVDFEILYSHPGTTSWRKYDDSEVSNAVPGGNSDGRLNFPCRALFNDALVPGVFDTDTKTCGIAQDGQAQNVSENVEILTKNGLGFILNTEIIFSHL